MRTNKSFSKNLVSTIALLLAGGLLLSACTTDNSAKELEARANNANSVDVMFAQMMIPHHEQAVVMADFALELGGDPQIIELAREIKGAQDPEIELMKSWAESWGVDMLPADQAMQAHGSHGMEGMLSQDQLDQLENARGEEFDRLFASFMIEHHIGAVAMAQDVLIGGKDPEVAALAREIIVNQEKEIVHLQSFFNAAGENQSVTISPALSHLHGGIIDSEGLLLGTHDGLHRVEPQTGRSTRVGRSTDDFMAFAGSASTTFVASGHPGVDSNMPNPLGLIRSSDGGVNWESVSMAGVVDFHSLAVQGTNVVGWDTRGPLQYSQDGGLTWTAGPDATPTSMAWFNNQVWLATPDAGLLTWVPGRKTMSAMDVPAVLLSVSPNGEYLWRMDRDGTVYRTNGQNAWKKISSVTRVEAFVADSEVAYAITGSTIEVISAL
jgi:uncharacterized protein (DUF305 family)